MSVLSLDSLSNPRIMDLDKIPKNANDINQNMGNFKQLYPGRNNGNGKRKEKQPLSFSFPEPPSSSVLKRKHANMLKGGGAGSIVSQGSKGYNKSKLSSFPKKQKPVNQNFNNRQRKFADDDRDDEDDNDEEDDDDDENDEDDEDDDENSQDDDDNDDDDDENNEDDDIKPNDSASNIAKKRRIKTGNGNASRNLMQGYQRTIAENRELQNQFGDIPGITSKPSSYNIESQVRHLNSSASANENAQGSGSKSSAIDAELAALHLQIEKEAQEKANQALVQTFLTDIQKYKGVNDTCRRYSESVTPHSDPYTVAMVRSRIMEEHKRVEYGIGMHRITQMAARLTGAIGNVLPYMGVMEYNPLADYDRQLDLYEDEIRKCYQQMHEQEGPIFEMSGRLLLFLVLGSSMQSTFEQNQNRHQHSRAVEGNVSLTQNRSNIQTRNLMTTVPQPHQQVPHQMSQDHVVEKPNYIQQNNTSMSHTTTAIPSTNTFHENNAFSIPLPPPIHTSINAMPSISPQRPIYIPPPPLTSGSHHTNHENKQKKQNQAALAALASRDDLVIHRDQNKPLSSQPYGLTSENSNQSLLNITSNDHDTNGSAIEVDYDSTVGN